VIAIIVSLGVVLALILAFKFLKKSQDLSKSESTSTTLSVESKACKANKTQAPRATLSLENRDNSIRPENYQQRNLDREVGGLEGGKRGVKEKKDEPEKIIEDIWDERSGDVDKMGSFIPLSGANKDLTLWKLKKIRLGIGKHLKHDHDENDKIGVGTHYDSSFGQQGGFSQIIKARQDFGRDNDGGGMGR
jgi:hypothetical protein